jgi:hypothetical protein
MKSTAEDVESAAMMMLLMMMSMSNYRRSLCWVGNEDRTPRQISKSATRTELLVMLSKTTTMAEFLAGLLVSNDDARSTGVDNNDVDDDGSPQLQ